MTIETLKDQLNKQLSQLGGDVALSIKFIKSSQAINVNEAHQFWAASVIKVAIASAFFKYIAENNLDKNSRTKVSTLNVVDGTGVLKLLDPADDLTLLDLVKLMLTISDNTATNQVIDLLGWEYINNFVNELGLKNTTFKHKMMIKEGRGPNLTTSEDILFLFEKLYVAKLEGAQEIISILKHQYDRTRIPLYIPNAIEIAHKPGSLPEAMHDTGIIFAKNPIIFVFLSDDQKDKKVTNEVLSRCAELCFNFSINNE